MPAPAGSAPSVERLHVAACRFPTDGPEADGTLAWDHTDVVVVEAHAAGRVGTGWTFAPAATRGVIDDLLEPVVVGTDALAPRAASSRMRAQVRNAGVGGLVGMAVSAVDIALWDLASRLLGVSLTHLLGGAPGDVAVYGSGGFTTYDDRRLHAQLDGWLDLGVAAVKIKVAEAWGGRVARDVSRVRQVVQHVGTGVEVFVDANGGYDVGRACRVGRTLDELGVTWFEEPVSSDEEQGLRRVRAAVAADVAAGEYVDRPSTVARLVDGCVDCLQLDVTRCGGYTGWLACAAVAAAQGIDVSAHCAPYLTVPVALATPRVRHLEYFHDHARIAHLLLEGAEPPHDGGLPAAPGPGHGLTLRPRVLEEHRVA